MIRKTISYFIDILKSPIMWIISLGILSDLGFTFSEFTSNSITRVGVIIADVISIIFR